MAKERRPGKVFVDWSQNDRHKTTVAPYSLRARPRPTVSTPLDVVGGRDGARRRRPDALEFETDAVLARVAELGDLYAPSLTVPQALPALA